MEKNELSSFEGRLTYVGYNWRTNHYGFCYGIVHEGECYSMFVMDEESEKKRIVLSKIPLQYLTSLEEPKRNFGGLELELIRNLKEKGISNTKSANNVPVEVERPYRE